MQPHIFFTLLFAVGIVMYMPSVSQRLARFVGQLTRKTRDWAESRGLRFDPRYMAGFALAPLAQTATPVSFDIDLDAVLTYAATIFNALMPVMAIGIGLMLGIGLVRFVSAQVRGIFG